MSSAESLDSRSGQGSEEAGRRGGEEARKREEAGNVRNISYLYFRVIFVEQFPLFVFSFVFL